MNTWVNPDAILVSWPAEVTGFVGRAASGSLPCWTDCWATAGW